MKKCKITVMRITRYEDLITQYENPIEHACDMKVGQVFIANGWEKPAGFCQSAWDTLSPFVLALSHGAELLILDEATSGLDPIVRDEVLDLLLDFVQDERHGVLVSSHITSDLEKIADYITYIHQGRVVLSDSKDAILEHYAKLGCTQAQLRDIRPGDLVRVRKGSFGCEALVRDRAAFARKYPGLMLDRVTLEDIMLLIGKGESA